MDQENLQLMQERIRLLFQYHNRIKNKNKNKGNKESKRKKII